jgi:hypothetical protein
MEGTRILKNSQIIILGICIAMGTIFSTMILSKSLIKIKKFSKEVISVTGSAEKKIVSDYSVWKMSFSQRAPELTAAYESLKKDLEKVRNYVLSEGFTNDEIVVSQVYTETLYKKNIKGYDTNKIEPYRLSQSVEVKSYDVQRVTKVSRKSTELLHEGISFFSESPQYFYTKLADLKLEMLAQSTEDAKKRAEKVASTTGSRISYMHSANMGVFQITPVNSYEVSSWGVNDTSSLEKKVTSVVHADFGIVE